jgi:protein-S-isoprenylcysteine O-methyltransferase Ste14
VAARRLLARWLVTGWLRPGVLVPLQGVAMVAHLLPGGPGVRPPRGVRAAGAGGLVAGAGLSLASALALGAELTPAVDPRPGARLRTEGVYAISRNPLYAGLLVASAGTVLLRGRASTLLAAAALAAVLHVKVDEEERMLAGRFGEEYEAYRRRVPRLVGFPGPATGGRR